MSVIAATSAVAAVFAGCRPTGAPLVDGILTAGLAAATVWLGASASWWVLVVTGGIAIAAAGSAWGVLVALVATALGLWLGSEQRSVVAVRCLSAALLVQVLLRLALNPFFGASAAIAGIGFVLLLGVSAQRRRRHIRRLLLRVLLVAGGVVVLAVAGAAAAVASARSDLTDGYEGAQDGLTLLQSGDIALAASTLHDAAAALHDADGAVSAPWSQPSRLLPIVAQHRNALASIVGRSAESTRAAAEALDA
ncbi:MAG: hypothetical protein WCC60_05460, partial [Ilumatobacteraceae bacterium]